MFFSTSSFWQLATCFLLLSTTVCYAAAAQPSLEAPQGVTARSSLSNAIAVSWQPVEGATGYTIEKSETGQDESFSNLATVAGDVNYYRHTEIVSDQTMWYRVKATADGAVSAVSSKVSATASSSRAVRIMPLGDSNTDGGSGSVPQAERIGYRKKLHQLLVENGELEGYKFIFVGSERSGQNFESEVDIDHAGFGGARDEDIALLLETGEFPFYGNENDYRGPGEGPYLDQYNPDIILLHIGTNWVDGSDGAMQDVKKILDQVDQYEARSSKEVIVIVAKIIKRVCYVDNNGTSQCPTPTEADNTIKYNNMLEAYVTQRSAEGDRLHLVDMQDGAGINYKYASDGGDMADYLHPSQNGYDKMAQVWYDALTSPMVPLPIELIDFKATVSEREVVLYWSTASENNNERFEVERMQEGFSFQVVGAVAGAGNSSQLLSYSFRDTSAPAGLLYYRLKQVDGDGTYAYSNVVAVQRHISAGNQPRLYPNLIDGAESIQIKASGFKDGALVSLTWVDAKGNKLHHQILKAGRQGELHSQIEKPVTLSKGLYFLKLTSPGKSHQVKIKVK
ncbi:SGNH/GDSL hydrolase family protein [Pontibacter korlensis]|uniref:SGNH/GDSL hydrolase family protein n=1 Tax=Pontibacter korlensis TaxID=400092 RepID=UPI0006967423|nr:SGNH/GDSL hydrolase family protein [Pontibacter korlensis]